MVIGIGQLAQKLTQCTAHNTPKLILLNGNEPLLIEEALDQIRQTLKPLGFSERIKFQAEAGFDWQSLSQSGQSMSLFSQQRIIELRVPKTLGTPGSKALVDYCKNASPDDVLIVIMPYLDKRQRQSAWYKACESLTWVVDSPDVTVVQFPQWIKQRLQSRALRVENGVIEMLAQQLEGNVLAAAQEIDKLQVLANDGAVTLELLTRCMSDQARFDVYVLCDTCLSGDWVKTRRILKRLKSEGIEPVIIVWAIVREIRNMASISGALGAGQSRAAVFKTYRVWRKREPVINAALGRLTSKQWYSALQTSAKLDQSIKGQRYTEVGSLWFQIEQLCGQVCAPQFCLTPQSVC